MPGIFDVLVISFPSLSIILISLESSVLELVAYTFTFDSPAVLNAIALPLVLPLPESLILLVKSIPLYSLLLLSTVTVDLLPATILNPSTVSVDFNFPVLTSLALRTSLVPLTSELVVFSVVFSVAFVVASVVFSVAFVVASVVFSVAFVASVVFSVAFVVASVTDSVSFSVGFTSSDDFPVTLIIWLAALKCAPRVA